MKFLNHYGTPFPTLVIQACAGIALVFGLLALAGWIADAPLLTTLRSGTIPMAPSTALIFISYGTIIFLSQRMLQNRIVKGACVVLTSLCIIVSIVIFILSSQDIFLDVEHVGFQTVVLPNGAPTGHMSPMTALGFMPIGIALLFLLLSCNRPWHMTLALLAALLSVMIGMVFTIAYLLGLPLMYGKGLVPPAIPTSVGLLVLGVALIVTVWQRWRFFHESKTSPQMPSSLLLLLIFAIMATGITLVGYLYFNNFEKQFDIKTEQEFMAITDMKAQEIARWRHGRLTNAASLFNNEDFSDLVARFLRSRHNIEAKQKLVVWLDKIRDAYEYDRVFLVNSQGTLLISSLDTPEQIPKHLAENIKDVERSPKVMFTDFYRDTPEGPIRISVLVPILDTSADRRLLGLLILNLEAQDYLYPLISWWPTPYRTAETLLIRREGEEVVFFNKPRSDKEKTRDLRVPLDRINGLVLQAAWGEEGIVEGVDYRGVPGLAAVQNVPDSPWFIIALMDKSELLAPLRERLWWMTSIVASLIIAAAAGIGAVWRQQRVHSYRKHIETAEELQRSELRFRETLDGMMEGCQTIGFDWRYIYLNDAAARAARRAKEDVIGRTMMEVFPGIENTELFDALKLCMKDRTERSFENEFTYPDGEKRWFQLSVQPVKEGLFILSTDITDFKRVDESLKESERRLVAAEKIAKVGNFTWDVESGEATWSEGLYDLLGYDLSEKIDYDKVNDSIHYPDDLARITKWLNDCLASGGDELTSNEYRLVRKNGDVIYVRTVGIIDRSDKDHPKVFATIQDITEQKKATQEIQAATAFLDSVIDYSPFSMWVSESDGTVIRTNLALQDALNLTEEQIVGKYNVLKDKNLEIQGVMSMVRDVFEKHKSARFSIPWQAVSAGDMDFSGGRDLFIDVSMFPILDGEGNLTNVVCQWIDITDEKTAEEELKKHRENLEDLIKEKMHELNERIGELERYKDATVEREIRIKELRDRISELETQSSE